MIRAIIAMGITLILTGCVSSGALRGVSSDGQVVHIQYEQGFAANDGQLSINMPSGETYIGKFVQKSSVTSGDDLVIGESSGDDALVFSDSETTSSSTSALLISNSGATMNCKFQFSDPSWGIEGGGIGSCKSSKGEVVNVTF